jgi:hypothetical protein
MNSVFRLPFKLAYTCEAGEPGMRITVRGGEATNGQNRFSPFS